MSDKLDVETINQMVDIAKKIAKENDFELDFSQKSVETLDKLMDFYHKTYIEDQTPDEEEYSGYSLSLGIYIGETLRKLSKHKNLEWYYGVSSAGGEATPYLATEDVEIFPTD